jgi:hypothetical protein
MIKKSRAVGLCGTALVGPAHLEKFKIGHIGIQLQLSVKYV